MPGASKQAAAVGVRQQRKQQTRQALLSAAKVVLARRGLAHATTREIAQQAKVAAGTFFVHFPDMSALIEALLDEHVARTLELALRSAPRKAGLVAQLVHVSKTLFDSYDAQPELSRAYIASSLFQSRAGSTLSARLSGFQAWVDERIADAIRRTELPEIDRELAFFSFFSLYFGLLVAGLNGLMPRKRQLALLQAALERLFLRESL